ncbi:type IV pilin protein [Synechococcus sp. PCC 7336]|uniref:type IV pilin protein n=1 Tax=Synechococcus sp. PCC 7336 TaxID=195250 RepID=UPI00034BB1E0|nr:prepilin-type N-terminal cleavage/methylation domain-containing protein [Synechococcus sp. PCC 7336]
MNSTLRAKLAQKMLKDAKGFTLIELLVVIVIVGVLSAVAVPTFLNQVRRARIAEAQAGLDVVGTASEIYRFDNGSYPSNFSAQLAFTSTNPTYMDAPWTQTAPNYLDPTILAASDASGAIFQTVADVANSPEYINGAQVALTCELGVGDQKGMETDSVEDGCNL